MYTAKFNANLIIQPQPIKISNLSERLFLYLNVFI